MTNQAQLPKQEMCVSVPYSWHVLSKNQCVMVIGWISFAQPCDGCQKPAFLWAIILVFFCCMGL